MLSIKLSYNNEIRRVALPSVTAGGTPSIGLSELHALTKRAFFSQTQATPSDAELHYTWTDEDGDVITVSSDEELRFAITCLHVQDINVFKFQVAPKIHARDAAGTGAQALGNSNAPVNSAVHRGVTCDECGMSPIVGSRFKCSVRPDFDLCQGCESTATQPYPMIKLYDADQSPMAILVAMDDRLPHHPRFGHGFGRHGHGHKHGHRKGHHGRPDIPVQPAANHQDGDGKPAGISAPWRGRCALKSAFINAFDAFSEMANQSVPVSAPAPAPKEADNMKANADVVTTEQALIDEAVRASLEEDQQRQVLESSQTWGVAITDMEQQQQPAATTTAADAVVTTPAISAPISAPEPTPVVVQQVPVTIMKAVEPKPAMRFVRDVTFHDGTKVQPGSVFVKTWRVRNDGVAAWTEGTALVTAGGDILTAIDLSVPVPLAAPGEEIEISVTMTAPAATGRHTAYFRLQKDGVYFGQRLWADVRVEDVDPSWFVLDASQIDLAASGPASSLVINSSSQFSEIVKIPPVVEQQPEPASLPELVLSDPVIAPVIASSPVASSPAVAPTPVPAASSVSSNAADVAIDVWARVWAAELGVLAQMGFTDVAALVPVLQANIQVPAALSESKRVSPDAMQAVVLHVLGMSV